MAKRNGAAKTKKYEDAASGTAKFFPAKVPVEAGGAMLTPEEMVATLLAPVASLKRIESLRAQIADAITTVRAEEKEADELCKTLRSIVIGQGGEDSVRLVEFGFRPHKKSSSSPTSRVQGSKDGVVTRKEVGPTGVRERKAAARALKAAKAKGGGKGGSGTGGGSGA